MMSDDGTVKVAIEGGREASFWQTAAPRSKCRPESDAPRMKRKTDKFGEGRSEWVSGQLGIIVPFSDDRRL